jgi:hypothetical protein
VAVGLEHAVLHGSDARLASETRWLLGIAVAGYLLSAAALQAQLGRRVRGALLWPGAGVPLALMIAIPDLAPAATTGLLAVVLVAGVVTGFLLHRSGEVRTTKV